MDLPIEWLPEAPLPPQLLILLHGGCGSAETMRPLAEALREGFPQAAILAPDAPWPGDGGAGRQWFSAHGIDDATRVERVQEALPDLLAWVRSQQRRLGVGAAATALAGFSQGAILALELASLADGADGRVLAFAGRYAALPATAPESTTLHLLHGGADEVIPVQHAQTALQRLGNLQGDATLDVAQGVGHELHPALIDSALFRLTHHIPYRTWRAALGMVPARPGPDEPGPPH